MMKRYFFTGLALLLPVVVTIVIVAFFINLLTKPFLNIVESLLLHYGLLNKTFLFISIEHFARVMSKIAIIITLILFTTLTGLLAKIYFARYMIRFGDNVLHRIPIVNKIYKAAQDVVYTVFSKEQQSFSQVVLVPFPHEGSYSIGMITSQFTPVKAESSEEDLISVFVPGTPNPTTGFMLMMSKKQLIFLDMRVDDAVKVIISCGVTLTSFKQLPCEEKDHEQPIP